MAVATQSRGAGGPASLKKSGGTGRRMEPAFKWLVTLSGIGVLLILATMITRTSIQAWPVFASEGFGFFTGELWSPGRSRSEVTGTYGAWPFIYGTLKTSAIALIVGVPLSVGIALFITEVAPPFIKRPLSYTVEMLAAVPSIVYALVGIYFLNPVLIRPMAEFLASTLGRFLPFFSPPVFGWNYFVAGMILALMIIPIITAISREVFSQVPADERYAAYAMGATRWEVLKQVVLPRSFPGVVGGTMLGLGRALGETIMVAFLIGASQRWETRLFFGGDSMAAVIVNTFQDAAPEAIWALLAIGVTLFLITMIVNVTARLIILKVGRVTGDAAA